MWQRIHADFAGPVVGRMFLVVIEAYSKWPEVAIMQSILAENMVEHLGGVFWRRCMEESVEVLYPRCLLCSTPEVGAVPPSYKWPGRVIGQCFETRLT